MNYIILSSKDAKKADIFNLMNPIYILGAPDDSNTRNVSDETLINLIKKLVHSTQVCLLDLQLSGEIFSVS